MDLILKHAARPARELNGFIAKARQLRPTAVVVCVLPAEGLSPDDEMAAEEADFVLLHPFSTQHLQAVLRQADDKLRLLQEVAALRSARRPVGPGHTEPARDSSARELTQVAKEFAKALAAGFDLPRVLDLFLDAVSELARPSRSAILLAEDEHRQYRVRASRGLAPLVVESVSLPPTAACPSGSCRRDGSSRSKKLTRKSADATAREIAREMAVLQAVVAIPACLATDSSWAFSPSASASRAGPTVAGKPRRCSTWPATSPRPFATSASIISSSTRKSSTSGSSSACRAAWSPSGPSSAW